MSIYSSSGGILTAVVSRPRIATAILVHKPRVEASKLSSVPCGLPSAVSPAPSLVPSREDIPSEWGPNHGPDGWLKLFDLGKLHCSALVFISSALRDLFPHISPHSSLFLLSVSIQSD